MTISYIAGLLTGPALILSYFGVRSLFSRGQGVECGNCGKVMGAMHVTPWVVAEMRWKAHYLRYWYITRPEWTCTNK